MESEIVFMSIITRGIFSAHNLPQKFLPENYVIPFHTLLSNEDKCERIIRTIYSTERINNIIHHPLQLKIDGLVARVLLWDPEKDDYEFVDELFAKWAYKKTYIGFFRNNRTISKSFMKRIARKYFGYDIHKTQSMEFDKTIRQSHFVEIAILCNFSPDEISRILLLYMKIYATPFPNFISLANFYAMYLIKTYSQFFNVWEKIRKQFYIFSITKLGIYATFRIFAN